MYQPNTTYRIQFHKDFTFGHLKNLAPYLQNLGINCLYASPIFEAVPGSVHGYDCTNPLRINPEIGTLDELRSLSKELQSVGIGWVQDIVPNHMAFHPQNSWLVDVLEKGEASEYASFFDIAPKPNDPLMVPFLGKSLEQVIQDGELKLVKEEGKLYLDYYGARYPLSAESAKETEAIGLQEISNDKSKLHMLARAQHYRLCHWQETDQRINYRRFFTVNGLICLNMQHEEVFQKHHQLVKALVDEGVFNGLRIDHIDGLQNPTEYLQRLRQLVGEKPYIIAEKILEHGEQLPGNWPLQGTSGYDFLAQVNNLFTNKKAEAPFTTYYQKLTGNWSSIHQQIRDKKAQILETNMNGELDNLYRLLLSLNLFDKRMLSVVPSADLKSALGEFLVQCPVYRFYGSSFPLKGAEEKAVQDILNRLKRSGESGEAVSILQTVFIQKPKEGNDEYNQRAARFYTRCLQFTGPLMAKGVEDTLMYTYNRFIGHNEVGDSPEAFGVSPQRFHQQMTERQQYWPLSLNATSTHDTKRGEDVRARLNVLTDLHEEWLAKVEEWRELNEELKGENGPDENDEYLLYQALAGHYHEAEKEGFADRLEAFLQKALREAKHHSNWTTPNEAYENDAMQFARSLLKTERPFWNSFVAFQQTIAEHGLINSLSQTLLKFALPGTPDTYQGCEGWDFSFVDPDNRRPVDYSLRQQWLQDLDDPKNKETLWKDRHNGRIKFWLTHQLMFLRKGEPALFAEGDYIPLSTSGKYRGYVFAFARKLSDRLLVFAVPLHTAELCRLQGKDFLELDWDDTAIQMPKESSSFEFLVSVGATEKLKGLPAQLLFKQLPFAIVQGRQSSKQRGAGILAHISSLPGPYGVGDIGSARAFADFLHRSRQTYWQLLPLNPTEAGQAFSPYSALSSKAGWSLFISPEALVREGLLTNQELSAYQLANTNAVVYEEAISKKNDLLSLAFERFVATKNTTGQQAFHLFCEKEKSWLDDFALFQYLKEEHNGQPWFQWPEPFKKRAGDALDEVQQQEKPLQKIKWLQYLFFSQWQELKNYCNNRNIQLIGDMPFYVSYDSADVWAAQHLFNLNEAGERTGIAGVPPDAFSADGQLWGMPTFNWKRMAEEGYLWWLQRLRKNMELFDLTRLDHFRAFEAYWEVPEGETTARNGKWIPGPGIPFFKVLQKEFGNLPFVAEDLGDINEAVLNLRDDFNLPGMKVLQFAFGEDSAQSDYIPHNYGTNFLVYTGTHDNNTTVGWWRTEADEGLRSRINQYIGQELTEQNIHRALVRLAYASVANVAIVPIQDVLGLDEKARMNVPSSSGNNWSFRLQASQLNQPAETQLQTWTRLYNR